MNEAGHSSPVPSNVPGPLTFGQILDRIYRLMRGNLRLFFGVAAVPGAAIWELGDWGIRTSRWEDLHIVTAWREFLGDPGLYFRYLLSD